MSTNALVIDLFSDTSKPVDRRLAGRALMHWESARRGRELPSLADYDAAGLPFSPSNTFVIRIAPRENDDEIVRAGEASSRAFGRNPVGLRALDIMPSAVERGLRFHRTAAELRKPIADVGGFTNARGREIMYRCVLLPLSEDQKTVDHVLGVFSFKIAE